MLEQLRRNWCIFSHWSSGKVISIILLLFHNLIPKCQQNLGFEHPTANVLEQMNINPREIHGNWRVGWALYSHTLASGPTTHSSLGELVYRVKPGRDRTQIRPIAEVAARFVKEKISIDGYPIRCYLEVIIPIPPSDIERDFQPVIEIAEKIGEILNVPAPSDYLTKVKATPLMKSTDHGMKRQCLRTCLKSPNPS